MTERDAPDRPGMAGMTRFAQRGFARLAYETRGDGARTVVLMHDLLADRTTLSGLRDALVDSGFRVVLPDLRGHGASAAIPGFRFTIAELVLDLLSILEAEAVTRVSVVGVGFGGAVALDFAVVEPARLERLVLVDPYLPGLPRDDPDPEVSAAAGEAYEQATKLAELANKGSVDRALDRYYGARRGADWRTSLSKARQGAMRRHANAFGPLLSAAFSYRPAGIDLHDPAWPALILLNPDLPEPDRAGIDRLRALLPGALVDNVGESKRLDEVIVRFLRQEAAGDKE